MALTNQDRQSDRRRWWEIHEQDTYVCPDCGRTRDEHRTEWEVHHVGREAGKIVGLCQSCHKIRHGADPMSVDLEFWKDGFLSAGD